LRWGRVNTMNFKLIATAGYPEMAQKIRRIAEEMGIYVTVVEGILQEAASEVKNIIENEKGYEVVISRAGTAQALREVIDLPVVNHDSDHFDLLQSFIRAKQLGEKVCFITYPEDGFLFNFRNIMDVIGFEVTILPYKNGEEMIEQIKKAREMGIDVVAGGGIRAAAIVRNYGMKAMYLSTSERTIKRAITLASKVAQDRIFIKEKAERLNAVINSSVEGILFLNKLGQVESCNHAAEKMFKVKENEILRKKADQLFDSELKYLLKLPNLAARNNFTYNNINVTCEPLIVDQVRIGTVITCRKVSSIQKLETKIRRELHQKGLVAKYTFDDVVHQSQNTKKVIQLARDYARTDSTVLIIGESGTGKELFAQGIHNASQRKEGPFVAVNCAAFPESILESELFGYVDGAFTGARRGGRQGVFELAHGGTIFLDEIGEIPAHIQTRLLRVLQEKVVMRIGDDKVTPVDIRVIGATNQKLWNLVQEGKFRLDLYFRLSVLLLENPPLSKRPKDIPVIVNHFLKKSNSQLMFEEFSEELQQFFLTYSWPGNVRQLENVLERLHLRVKDIESERDFIRDVMNETATATQTLNSQSGLYVELGSMEEIEQQVIAQMLQRHDHNRTLVAEQLGISRTTLWKKLNRGAAQ